MTISEYNQRLDNNFREIAERLCSCICDVLSDADCKIWHAHPVWFLNNNPIVGYSLQKKGCRLMFWSGAEFGEDWLRVRGKKFKDASVFLNNIDEIDENALRECLRKSREIQNDYGSIVKNKGVLNRLT